MTEQELAGMIWNIKETFRKYRQAFTNRNPRHPYEELSDKDFLIQMAGISSTVAKG